MSVRNRGAAARAYTGPAGALAETSLAAAATSTAAPASPSSCPAASSWSAPCSSATLSSYFPHPLPYGPGSIISWHLNVLLSLERHHSVISHHMKGHWSQAPSELIEDGPEAIMLLLQDALSAFTVPKCGNERLEPDCACDFSIITRESKKGFLMNRYNEMALMLLGLSSWSHPCYSLRMCNPRLLHLAYPCGFMDDQGLFASYFF